MRIFTTLAVLLALVPSLAVAKSPEDFVTDVKDNVVKVLENKDLSVAQQREELESLFNLYVDSDWIAQFVLGKHWRTATDAQKSSYLKLYHEYLTNNYVGKFDGYLDAEITILRVNEISDTESTVSTTLKLKNEPAPLRIDYRVRKTGDNYKIIDISGEGVSLINTQRTDFGSAISRKGLDFFLSRLEVKVEKMRAKNIAAN